MTNNNKNNREILKANRNLYKDQITFIKLLSIKTNKSESEVLRGIIDFYMKPIQQIEKETHKNG